MPTAIITLNVTSFVANGCCAATPTVTDSGGGRVYQNAGSSTVYVKSKGKSALALKFVITPANTYTVNGITFTGQLSDPNGAATFTSPAITSGAIQVNDTFAAQPNWSYAISITKASTGETGTIDPVVTNTDEN